MAVVRRACCRTLDLLVHRAESAAVLRQAPPPRCYSSMSAARGRTTWPHSAAVVNCPPHGIPSASHSHSQYWYSTSSRGSKQEKHKDLYAIMGLSPHATQQQIKDAYYNLSMKYHPDRNKGSAQAHDKFTELTEAYSILGQYDTRRKYDKGLLHQYPRQPHHTHRHEHGTPASKSTVHGGSKVKFDFDEFYRAHYGEALKRDREARSKKRAAKERAKLYSLSNNWQQAFIIGVTVSVLLVGWYGYRWQRNRTDFRRDTGV